MCEAAKTEPAYFSALARDFDLPNVSIRSPKRGQWGPAGITTTVRQESEQDSDLDEIWCVLDHDERDTEIEDFRSWLGQQSNENADATKIRAAISTPCFEYWLLLHFTFTNKPFQGTPGGPSACQQVIRELETYIEGYRKAGGGTYERCREQLPTAIQNAKRIRRSGRRSSPFNLRRQARQAVTLAEQRGIQEKIAKLERQQRRQRRKIFCGRVAAPPGRCSLMVAPEHRTIRRSLRGKSLRHQDTLKVWYGLSVAARRQPRIACSGPTDSKEGCDS